MPRMEYISIPIPPHDEHLRRREEEAKRKFITHHWRTLGRMCLFALIFLTPIIVVPLQAVADVTKTALLSILILVALVAFFGVFITERKIIYPRSILFGAVLIIAVVVGVSTFFSISPRTSFYGNFALPDSFLTALIILFSLFLSAVFFNRKDLPTIGWLILGSVLCGTVINLLSVFGISLPFGLGIYNLNPFGSLNAWGMFMATALLMVIQALFIHTGKSHKRILIASAILFACGLLILNYQFIWITFTLLMMILAALRFIAHNKFGSSFTLLVIALFLALISVHLPSLLKIPPEIRPSFSSTMTIIGNVFAGPRAVLGSGPGTFAYDWAKFRPQEINNTSLWAVRFGQGFGFYQTLLVTTGILGLLAFFFYIYALARTTLRSFEDPVIVSMGMGILCMCILFFFFPATNSEIFLLGLASGLLLIQSGIHREFSLAPFSRPAVFGAFIGAIILLAGSLVALYFFVGTYMAVIWESEALRALAAGNTRYALSTTGRAIDLNETPEYLRTESQALLLQARELINQGALVSNDTAVRNRVQTLINNTVQIAERAVTLDNVDSSNWINLGQIYETLAPNVTGADAFAESAYRNASELEPKNPEITLSIGRVLLNASDRVQGAERIRILQGAKVALDTAVALKPDYAASHLLFAQLYLRVGDSQNAIAQLNEARATNPFDAELAFQIGLMYYQGGQMQLAEPQFESAVSLNGDYANARYFLGLTYDSLGVPSRALEQFKKIADANPDNQEIARIIKNLEEGRKALQDITPPEKTKQSSAKGKNN